MVTFDFTAYSPEFCWIMFRGMLAWTFQCLGWAKPANWGSPPKQQARRGVTQQGFEHHRRQKALESSLKEKIGKLSTPSVC